MKFSRTLDYTLRSINYLSKRSFENNSGFVTVEEIARNENLPFCYLSKILKRLSENEIVTSLRGHGVVLIKPLDKITLGEIVYITNRNGNGGKNPFNGFKERIDKFLNQITLDEIINGNVNK